MYCAKYFYLVLVLWVRIGVTSKSDYLHIVELSRTCPPAMNPTDRRCWGNVNFPVVAVGSASGSGISCKCQLNVFSF